MHALRMFMQVMKYALSITFLLWLLLLIILFTYKTTTRNRYFLYEYFEAQIKVCFNDKAYNLIQNSPGMHPSVIEIPSLQFLKAPLTLYHVDCCLNGFKWALVRSSGVSLTLFIIFLSYLTQKGRRAKASHHILGNNRVSPKVLKKKLEKSNEASDLRLGGVPLVKNTEVQHILLAGTTGTGKSVCMQELMDQVRFKAQKAVLFDIDGALVANYYRPEKDILLNPLDERCPPWNIWQECQDRADFETLAHSLMPLHLSGNDPFWINAAHTIFTELAYALSFKEKSNRLLLDALFTQQLESLSLVVSGTPAEALVSERNEKTALSIKATLSTYCKSLLYLRDDTQGPLFSIRRWLESDNEDSWLFIATDTQKSDALKPLLSVFLDVAAKSVLSLPPHTNRRIWFFADELPKLHRLPSLKSLLERGRKYGASFVGSVQDVHQIHSVYGRNDAETLTSLFNTKVFFRSQEPESIAWMSKVMGGIELIEKKEGFSYGANDMRDGVSIHQERRREPVVKEAEFSLLPDLHAFLKLPGDWPVTEVIFKVQNRTFKEPYFVPRLNSEKVVEPKKPKEPTTFEEPLNWEAV